MSSLFFSHCLLNGLALEGVEVEAAHVAGAGVLRRHEVLELLLEELPDDFEVRGGPTFHSELQPLNFSLSTLQSVFEFGAADANVLTG